MNALKNPFPPRNEITNPLRISVDIPHADAMFVRSVCPEPGIFTAIVNNFLHCIINECKQRNWTLANYSDLVSFVNERCSTSCIDANRPSFNDGRRASEVRRPATRNPNKSRNRRSVEAPTSDVDVANNVGYVPNETSQTP